MVSKYSHTRRMLLTFCKAFILLLSCALTALAVVLGVGAQQAGQHMAHAQVLPSAATPGISCGWQVAYPPLDATPTDNHIRPVGTLAGVTAISSSDVWAVGYTGLILERNANTQTLHWNGSQWILVPPPFLGVLQGVSAISSTDVWAVGTDRSSGVAQTLTLHWDGTVWSRVRNSIEGILAGVVAISPNDVWAVGTTEPLDGTPAEALTMHWDGTSWDVVPNPSAHAACICEVAIGRLLGVTATGTADVWAVGWYASQVSSQKALVLHWNGQAWAISPINQIGQFNAVAASTPHDVWAVGVSTGGAGSLTEHWDGSGWTQVPSPNPGSHLPNFSNANVLTGVSETSAGDVWAVGVYADYTFDGVQSLALHWDGRSWLQVDTP
ncbi:MAG: hypothetical protein M3014_07915, partial [Chloroflexota bacterium]|nr:hypothetical protein [Chloroflexota bacterium]